MSRHSQRIIGIPYITVHHGTDHALGSFWDLTDDRYAGHPKDPQGEGYIFEYSKKFGISTNLADLTLREATYLTNRAIQKIDNFIESLDNEKEQPKP